MTGNDNNELTTIPDDRRKEPPPMATVESHGDKRQDSRQSGLRDVPRSDTQNDRLEDKNDGEECQEESKENMAGEDEEGKEEEDRQPEEEPDSEPEMWADDMEDQDPESIDDESPSRLEWIRQKREDGQQNMFLDRIMCMTGYEKVKAHCLWAKTRVDVARRWGEDMKDLKLDLLLHGKSNTEKKWIAQNYAELLYSLGAIPYRRYHREDGCWIRNLDGRKPPAVIFFEDADEIDTPSNLEAILRTVNELSNGAVLIFSYRLLDKRCKNALKCSNASRRRLPEPIRIEAYSLLEVTRIIRNRLRKEDDFRGSPLDTIAEFLATKVMTHSTEPGEEFDSCVSNEVEEVRQRWSRRVEAEWLAWGTTHEPGQGSCVQEEKRRLGGVMIEDARGPEVTFKREDIGAWRELQKLIGLQTVKDEVDHLFDLAEFNKQRAQQGKRGMCVTLNRCFMGPPGVGKTTVVGLYAEVLSSLGLLSRGHIIFKTPVDLLSGNIAGSEELTRKALEESLGGILVIDDAHMLRQASGHGTGKTDAAHGAIIDTLVAMISGGSGEDRSVLLCGYEYRMEEMLNNMNEGLRRRFPLESAVRFADYTEDELVMILEQKMAEDEVTISTTGLQTAREVLGRMRTRPKFGNGGDVESLLSRARLRQVTRLKTQGVRLFDHVEHPLEPVDFDPDSDRVCRADENRSKLFQGMVGMEEVMERFRRWQKMADGMRRHGMDPRQHIPWAFIFKGPPGTGKTTVARKIGKLFYDMGLLSSDDVHTCSVTDIIGEYLGQTGPKVLTQFEDAIGKVLFIDEAYRLAATDGGGGSADRFAKEAVGEVVDAMTKPRYMGKMIVILAGYDEEMEMLLQTNPGLRSRFPTHIDFPTMKAESCLEHLTNQLSLKRISVPPKLGVDASGGQGIILEALSQLVITNAWANGRDVETLAKNVMERVFVRAGEIDEPKSDVDDLQASLEDLAQACLDMLEARTKSRRTLERANQGLIEFRERLQRGADGRSAD